LALCIYKKFPEKVPGLLSAYDKDLQGVPPRQWIATLGQKMMTRLRGISLRQIGKALRQLEREATASGPERTGGRVGRSSSPSRTGRGGPSGAPAASGARAGVGLGASAKHQALAERLLSRREYLPKVRHLLRMRQMDSFRGAHTMIPRALKIARMEPRRLADALFELRPDLAGGAESYGEQRGEASTHENEDIISGLDEGDADGDDDDEGEDDLEEEDDDEDYGDDEDYEDDEDDDSDGEDLSGRRYEDVVSKLQKPEHAETVERILRMRRANKFRGYNRFMLKGLAFKGMDITELADRLAARRRAKRRSNVSERRSGGHSGNDSLAGASNGDQSPREMDVEDVLDDKTNDDDEDGMSEVDGRGDNMAMSDGTGKGKGKGKGKTPRRGPLHSRPDSIDDDLEPENPRGGSIESQDAEIQHIADLFTTDLRADGGPYEVIINLNSRAIVETLLNAHRNGDFTEAERYFPLNMDSVTRGFDLTRLPQVANVLAKRLGSRAAASTAERADNTPSHRVTENGSRASSAGETSGASGAASSSNKRPRQDDANDSDDGSHGAVSTGSKQPRMT
jgi:hypothetical protein